MTNGCGTRSWLGGTLEGKQAIRWIGWLWGALWRFSRRTWVSVNPDLRPRSPVSGLYLFLFLVFFIIGLILILLGVDLNDVDVWLEAQSGWLDVVGSVLFRALCGFIMLMCAVVVVGGVCQRVIPSLKDDDRITVGMMIGAVPIAYFAWFGVVG